MTPVSPLHSSSLDHSVPSLLSYGTSPVFFTSPSLFYLLMLHTPLQGWREAMVHVMGSAGAMLVSMVSLGCSGGCSTRCSLYCKIKNKPFALALCNATSSCFCSCISSTHEDFILHQVSLHGHLPYLCISMQKSPALPGQCLEHFWRLEESFWTEVWGSAPCSVPCRTRGM